jgi:hypothetical protein
MKKSDMEAHHAAYQAHSKEAHAAEQGGMYKAAIGHAKAGWPHAEGFVHYVRKVEEREPGDLRAFHLVLKYAPLLLDYRTLDDLGKFAEEHKRSQVIAALGLGDLVSAARQRMLANHRLWSYLQDKGDVVQSQLRTLLGGEQEDWRETAETWSEMGLLDRTPLPGGGTYCLSLATRMGQLIPAKCPQCGHVAEAPKAMFLEPMTCPECDAKVSFVLLARRPAVAAASSTTSQTTAKGD